MSESRNILGIFAAIWGFCGSFSLIAFAIWRLSPIALESMNYALSSLQWLVLAGFAIYMAYAEGYKGFQRGFAPRVAARSLYLANNPTPLRVILAPLFVVGYFHASRKRLITSYALTIMIIGFILLLKFVDQPWRGIIDVGVVVGLAWGLASMLYFIVRAIVDENYSYSPEMPEST